MPIIRPVLNSPCRLCLRGCCICSCCALLRLQKGKEGVREQYETTDEFHEKWRMKARDMLAKSEWRRRKLTKRVSQEQQQQQHALVASGVV